MPLTRDEDIARRLTNARTIAVVGASDRPDRPSYGVMKFLQAPWATACSRSTRRSPASMCWASSCGASLPRSACRSTSFGPLPPSGSRRRSGRAGDLRRREGGVETHLGVINHEAAARAEAAGLEVVMDRCPHIEIPRLPRAADRRPRLGGPDGHFGNEQGRCVDTPAELQVARRLKRREHVDEVGGDGDLGHRLGDLAAAHDEPRPRRGCNRRSPRSPPGRSTRRSALLRERRRAIVRAARAAVEMEVAGACAGAPPTPRAAWPVGSIPSCRAEALSAIHWLRMPSATSSRRDTPTPSPSNGRERSPRSRNGWSTIVARGEDALAEPSLRNSSCGRSRIH